MPASITRRSISWWWCWWNLCPKTRAAPRLTSAVPKLSTRWSVTCMCCWVTISRRAASWLRLRRCAPPPASMPSLLASHRSRKSNIGTVGIVAWWLSSRFSLLFLPGDGLQHWFREAAAPPSGASVEVLYVSSAEALFSAAATVLAVGAEATYKTDVAQSPASYPL